MQDELKVLKEKKLDHAKEIELCYHVVNKYWLYIKTVMKEYIFKSKNEEIIFFKTIKPKFLAEKEYYSLVYHAYLFLPPDNGVIAKDFWLREKERLEKFITDNQLFYDYYKTGRTDRDEDFFLKDDLEAEGPFTASYSQMIGTILALERYNCFVRKKLEPNRKNYMER
jgi:hypothetical protein